MSDWLMRRPSTYPTNGVAVLVAAAAFDSQAARIDALL
jgi:hypothetical protein